MNKNIPLPLVIFVIASIVGYLIFELFQAHRSLDTLLSIPPQQVTIFRIYPKVIRAVGSPVEFTVPDPIIDDFFQALTDFSAYSPNHDTVASQDHNWYMEISTNNTTIQIKCYLPFQKSDIVVGKPRTWGSSDAGYFQSRKLFQWYQTYSHRWLEAGEREEEDKKVRR